MWKITVKYDDGGKAEIVGKQKDINLELAKKYYKQFKCDLSDRTATYQKYPLKSNPIMSLKEKMYDLITEEGSVDDEVDR